VLNQEILSILKFIKNENAQAFFNPKQFNALMKDLTNNNRDYNAIIRWLGISISEFDAFSKIESDYKNKQDFARHTIVSGLVSEGASEDTAKDVAEYWAALVGFSFELPISIEWCSTCGKKVLYNCDNKMIVCTNFGGCKNCGMVLDSTNGKLISGEECPMCKSKRDYLNSGKWYCKNENCADFNKIDYRFFQV
jgi:hypothetical protein